MHEKLSALELAQEMLDGSGPVPLARLQELMSYDPESGEVRWKVDRLSGRYRKLVNARAGDIAGCKGVDGYISLSVDRKRFRAHQAAFALYHGRWATKQLDHINGNRSDNRIANLREVTNAENGWNRGKPKTNTSGYKGVRMGTHGRWTAGLSRNGRHVHLGYFDTPEQAHEAYAKAVAEHHGEFGRAQ